MQRKEAYYSPSFSTTQNSSPTENSVEHIVAAEKAYEKFSSYDPQTKEITITYENSPIQLTTILGKGGSKLVYDLGNGYAVGLLNIQSNPINIPTWERLIREEVAASQKLRQLGLCTQSYAEATLCFDGYPAKVLKMPTFALLATRGQQVRDSKNSNQYYGTSLLFGNLSNLQSFAHWQKVLQGFQEDLVIYYSESLKFDTDTFNLAIVDSPETPAHDRTALALFTERKQKVRFCFYDFSSKHAESKETKYDFLNSDGNLEREFIEQKIDYLFDRVTSIISVGLLPIEYVNILGGIHALLLVSEDAEIKEIPEKTIVLKKMQNEIHYAYFIDQTGVLKEIKIGKIDFKRSISLAIALINLSEKFPSSGEMEKKITINEDETLIQSIASKCDCKQYSKLFCALNIVELAKSALEEIKPLFVKDVADKIIEKLEQLPLAELQRKFKIREPINEELKCVIN